MERGEVCRVDRSQFQRAKLWEALIIVQFGKKSGRRIGRVRLKHCPMMPIAGRRRILMETQSTYVIVRFRFQLQATTLLGEVNSILNEIEFVDA